jgi:hypothetical protein
MDGACSAHGGNEKIHTKLQSYNLKGRNCFYNIYYAYTRIFFAPRIQYMSSFSGTKL